MRTCPNCGASVSETDEFCGNCGTYLAWLRPENENPAPEGSDQPLNKQESPPVRRPPTAGTSHQVGQPVTEESSRAGRPVAEMSSQGVRPATESSRRAVAPAGEASPRAVPPAAETDQPAGETDQPAGETVRPVGETQPGAVAPARPVAPRRAPVVRETTEAASDGPVCGNCGTVNPVGAKFCRHCGHSLAETAASAPVPWWRRLRWRRRFRVGGSPWPRRIVVLVILAVLVIVGFLVFPYAANLGQGVLDKLSTATPISPTSTTGSGAVAGHPVTAADDGVTNRYWGAPAVGAWAQFGFAQPFRLLGVVITPGASTDPTGFDSQARPTAVDLVITTASGSTTTLPVTVADKPGPQTTNTGISDVVTVRLVIRTATPLAPGRSIALGEIEFFKRS